MLKHRRAARRGKSAVAPLQVAAHGSLDPRSMPVAQPLQHARSEQGISAMGIDPLSRCMDKLNSLRKALSEGSLANPQARVDAAFDQTNEVDDERRLDAADVAYVEEQMARYFAEPCAPKGTDPLRYWEVCTKAI